jgi:hypothetical protein
MAPALGSRDREQNVTDITIVAGGVKRLESISASAEQGATLTANADAIRMLRRRAVNDIIEIGQRLVESREIIRQASGHGHWLNWLNTEFGWTDRTALNFIRVFEMSKSENFSDLGRLPRSALYMLAAPSTPEAVRTEILDRAKAGDDISVEDVKEAIADAKTNETPDDDAAESAEKRKRAYADTEEAEEEEEAPVEEEEPGEQEEPEESPTFRSQCFDAVVDLRDMVEAIEDTNAPVLAQPLKLLGDAEHMLAEPEPERTLAEQCTNILDRLDETLWDFPADAPVLQQLLKSLTDVKSKIAREPQQSAVCPLSDDFGIPDDLSVPAFLQRERP